MEPIDNTAIYEKWKAAFAELDDPNSIDMLFDLVIATNRRIDELNTLCNTVFQQVEAGFQQQGAAIQALVQKPEEKSRLILPR